MTRKEYLQSLLEAVDLILMEDAKVKAKLRKKLHEINRVAANITD